MILIWLFSGFWLGVLMSQSSFYLQNLSSSSSLFHWCAKYKLIGCAKLKKSNRKNSWKAISIYCRLNDDCVCLIYTSIFRNLPQKNEIHCCFLCNIHRKMCWYGRDYSRKKRLFLRLTVFTIFSLSLNLKWKKKKKKMRRKRVQNVCRGKTTYN